MSPTTFKEFLDLVKMAHETECSEDLFAFLEIAAKLADKKADLEKQNARLTEDKSAYYRSCNEFQQQCKHLVKKGYRGTSGDDMFLCLGCGALINETAKKNKTEENHRACKSACDQGQY